MERGAERFFADLPDPDRRTGRAAEHLSGVASTAVERLRHYPNFLRLLIVFAIQPPRTGNGEIVAVIGHVREMALQRLRKQIAIAFDDDPHSRNHRPARSLRARRLRRRLPRIANRPRNHPRADPRTTRTRAGRRPAPTACEGTSAFTQRRTALAGTAAARAELAGSPGCDVGGCASNLGVSCEAVKQSAIERLADGLPIGAERLLWEAREDLRQREGALDMPAIRHDLVDQPQPVCFDASISRPVITNSSALETPTVAVRRVVPPSRIGTPHLRSGKPNRASSVAIRKSHHKASTSPAATHQPEIAAIVGLGETRRVNPRTPSTEPTRGASVSIAFKSAPALNAFSPLPVTTSTRAFSSAQSCDTQRAAPRPSARRSRSGARADRLSIETRPPPARTTHSPCWAILPFSAHPKHGRSSGGGEHSDTCTAP